MICEIERLSCTQSNCPLLVYLSQLFYTFSPSPQPVFFITYPHIPTEKRGKLDSKTVKCILLGYEEEAGSRAHRLFNLTTKRIECSRDVIINEYSVIKQISNTVETGSEIEIELPDLQD